MKKKRREGKGGSRGQQAKEQKRKRTNTNQKGGKGGGGGTGSPGTSLARKTRCQMGRRTMSQVKGCNAARGNIAKWDPNARKIKIYTVV